MADRPTTSPTWATTLGNDPTTGQPNRAEPDAGKKAVGFTFNEKPPRQWFNWLLWAFGEWIAYFAERIDQSLVAGASPRFAKITNTSNIDLEANDGAADVNVKGDLIVKDAQGDSYANISAAGVATVADLVPAKVRGSTTNITGTELETLSAGNEASALHVHKAVSDFGCFYSAYASAIFSASGQGLINSAATLAQATAVYTTDSNQAKLKRVRIAGQYKSIGTPGAIGVGARVINVKDSSQVAGTSLMAASGAWESFSFTVDLPAVIDTDVLLVEIYGASTGANVDYRYLTIQGVYGN